MGARWDSGSTAPRSNHISAAFLSKYEAKMAYIDFCIEADKLQGDRHVAAREILIERAERRMLERRVRVCTVPVGLLVCLGVLICALF